MPQALALVKGLGGRSRRLAARKFAIDYALHRQWRGIKRRRCWRSGRTSWLVNDTKPGDTLRDGVDGSGRRGETYRANSSRSNRCSMGPLGIQGLPPRVELRHEE